MRSYIEASLVPSSTYFCNNNNNVNCLLKIKLHFITLDINFKHVNIFTSLSLFSASSHTHIQCETLFCLPIMQKNEIIRRSHSRWKKMLLWVIPHYFYFILSDSMRIMRMLKNKINKFIHLSTLLWAENVFYKNLWPHCKFLLDCIFISDVYF